MNDAVKIVALVMLIWFVVSIPISFGMAQVLRRLNTKDDSDLQ